MRVKELQDKHRIAKGNMTTKRLAFFEAPAQASTAKRQQISALRGKFAQAHLGAAFISASQDEIESSKDVYLDQEFYVCYGEEDTDISDSMDKVALETAIIEAGGKITQYPTATTSAVISGRMDGLRLNNVRKRGDFDIIKSSWMKKCIAERQLVSLLPEHYVAVTTQTQKRFDDLVGPYGDSFIAEISEEELRALLTRLTWPRSESTKLGIDQLRQEIKERYLAYL